MPARRAAGESLSACADLRAGPLYTGRLSPAAIADLLLPDEPERPQADELPRRSACLLTGTVTVLGSIQARGIMESAAEFIFEPLPPIEEPAASAAIEGPVTFAASAADSLGPLAGLTGTWKGLGPRCDRVHHKPSWPVASSLAFSVQRVWPVRAAADQHA